MQIGLEPKPENIIIRLVGEQYEIMFENGDCEFWFYLDRKELAELRNKINDILIGKDYKSDMLREKQDYIDEVRRAGGKVE